MTNQSSEDRIESNAAPGDFSFVLGGPLFQLLLRAHLVTDAMELLVRRIVVLSLFAWLPLLVLSAVGGALTGAHVAMPFLKDVQVHARFLGAMPLLIAAELIVHQRMRSVVEQFRERRLIPPDSMPRFESIIASAFRLRNSVLAEALMIGVVYAFGVLVVWRQFVSLAGATWYATPTGEGTTLTPAGAWLCYVSLPLFQFLLVRWYFRIFVWARFLFQVSRLPLNPVPTHPDRVGGLAFLSATGYAFSMLAAAHGVLLAGTIANRIFYAGAALADFKIEIVVVVVFLLCAVFVPLLFFSSRLAEAKRRGLREYGTLAERYVHEFDKKWLRGGAAAGEAFIGSADIQSLADIGAGFDVVNEMRTAPITRDALVGVVVSTLVPILPLVLTMMPLEELLRRLAGVLF
jgi:hypothetical protein